MQEGQLTAIEYLVGAKCYCALDRTDLVQTSQQIWRGILLLHSAVGDRETEAQRGQGCA